MPATFAASPPIVNWPALPIAPPGATLTGVMHSEFYRGLEAAESALRAASTDAAARTAAAHDALAPLLDDTPARPTRACEQGCAHCCHFPVGVSWGEALRLVHALEGNAAAMAAVQTDHLATIDSAWDELAGRPCPLLRDGACTFYDQRPMPCRAMASSDAEACAAALHGQSAAPIDETAFARGLGAAAALAAGPPTGTRELRAAVSAMLQVPTAERERAFLAARGPDTQA